jgi:methylated-DNA-[protein]-cysteine S-methyltransferase
MLSPAALMPLSSVSNQTMESTSMENSVATVYRETQKGYVYRWLDSPVGRLKLIATDQALVGVLWEKEDAHRARLNSETENNTHPLLVEADCQIDEYFRGRRQTFDLKLDLIGTDFQRAVWHALLTIPFGETRTYEQIARQIGKPTAMRAVGAANGRNPISIVVPCHRVIGSSGELTGFAGGLDAKAFLLKLEAGSRPSKGGARISGVISRPASSVAVQEPAPVTRQRAARCS